MKTASPTLLSRGGRTDTFAAPEKFAQRVKTCQRLILLIFVSFVLVIILVMGFVQMDEKIRAEGVVGARDDEISFALEDGAVAEIRQGENARVKKGELIMQLDIVDLERQRLQLQNQLAEVESERQVKLTRLETTRKNPLPKEFLGSESELSSAQSQYDYQFERLRKLDDLRKQGYASEDQIKTQQLATKAAEDDLNKAKEKNKIVTAGYSDQVIKDSESEVTLLQTKVDNLKRLLADIDNQIERRNIKAPADGVITLLGKRHVGEPVKRGDHLMHISSSSAVEVKLFVRQIGVNRIVPNQEVLIRSSVYNWQRYGLALGNVSFISREAMLEGSSSPIPGEHRYLVVANVNFTPQPLPLGSAVSGEIVIRKATIWKLLFGIEKK
ncbi:MAG: HlyD family efflux transporter periplasmic adaptor subunit [Verrucomicrobiae bacterium]|nr:HlyD family efflux transporter periplasmic adaptor subunit [Verrucomicrobiae bacterium]